MKIFNSFLLTSFYFVRMNVVSCNTWCSGASYWLRTNRFWILALGSLLQLFRKPIALFTLMPVHVTPGTNVWPLMIQRPTHTLALTEMYYEESVRLFETSPFFVSLTPHFRVALLQNWLRAPWFLTAPVGGPVGAHGDYVYWVASARSKAQWYLAHVLFFAMGNLLGCKNVVASPHAFLFSK